MDVRELLAAVEREFAVTGAATPSWPDPRPPGWTEPSPEQYSRVTAPERYSIVGARVEAWVRALTAVGLARANESPGRVFRAGHPEATVPARVLRVVPAAAHALRLTFTLDSALAPDDVVSVGAGDAAVEIDRVPDCGCDACDSGSDDLLSVIDEAVLDVVTGALIHVRLGGTTAIAGRERWQAGGSGPRMTSRQDIDAAFAAVRAGTWRTEDGPVVHGAAWF